MDMGTGRTSKVKIAAVLRNHHFKLKVKLIIELVLRQLIKRDLVSKCKDLFETITPISIYFGSFPSSLSFCITSSPTRKLAIPVGMPQYTEVCKRVSLISTSVAPLFTAPLQTMGNLPTLFAGFQTPTWYVLRALDEVDPVMSIGFTRNLTWHTSAVWFWNARRAMLIRLRCFSSRPGRVQMAPQPIYGRSLLIARNPKRQIGTSVTNLQKKISLQYGK